MGSPGSELSFSRFVPIYNSLGYDTPSMYYSSCPHMQDRGDFGPCNSLTCILGALHVISTYPETSLPEDPADPPVSVELGRRRVLRQRTLRHRFLARELRRTLGHRPRLFDSLSPAAPPTAPPCGPRRLRGPAVLPWAQGSCCSVPFGEASTAATANRWSEPVAANGAEMSTDRCAPCARPALGAT